MKKRFKYALLGMTIVPLFGRVALHGTGHEDDLYRFLMPMLVGGVAGFLIGLVKDRLLASLEQFRSILDAVPYGAVQCDSHGKVLFANKKICDHLGFQEKEIIGKPIWSYCSNDICRNTMQKSLSELVQSGASPEPILSSFLSSTGSEMNVEVHWACHENHNAALGGYTATVIDITGLLHSQGLLKKLSQVVEHADELIMITDRYGIIEYVNPALEATSGYSFRELVGENPSILKSPAQDPSVYGALWQTIASGQVWRGSMIDRRKDGSFYPVEMSVTPILNEDGVATAYVSIQQDMTEHQELENQLIQSRKMEALGTLVGGIAHDFNNMLAAVKGNTYLAKNELDDEKQCEYRLTNIEGLVDQGADMIRQLLTFARKDRVEKQHFSLNAFMLEGYRLAQAAIPENIEHVTEFCEEKLVVFGSVTQIQQVMMNLVNNACDAVAAVENPKIVCSLNRFEADAMFSRAHPDLQGSDFARITVSDNGEGIKKERLSKIFEPFFTTKGVGEGTGLGLAMVFGAISAHEGAIEVASEEGRGTEFNIYLPLSTTDVETEIVDEAELVSDAGGETILLADDDEELRATTCEVLESLGYQVIEAADGEAALTLFKRREKEIGLILTDIVMPKMGGIDLIKAVRMLNQDVPVIYITGYDGGSEQARSIEQDAKKSRMIRKPFTIPALHAAIGRMLVHK